MGGVLYTEEEARANVERGLALLDREYLDWLWRVEPPFLRMQDGCRCVLGQLGSGTYADVIERLWPDVGDEARDRLAHDHGFVVGLHIELWDSAMEQETYLMLTRLWREAIEDRRAEQSDVRVPVDLG